MKILAFDTSNKTLALALLEDDQLLADVTLNIKKNHSISLMPAIDYLVASVDLTPADLDRIVVAKGPGSYTGLRVAVATAKMLAYSLSIDLVGVSSLYALAAPITEPGLIVPLINARRNNVYVGFYRDQQAIRPDKHAPLEAVLAELAKETQVTFTGEVAEFAEQLSKALPHAQIRASLPSAYEIGKKGRKLPPENPHAFVPDYLKKVEAEENWLKNHQPDPKAKYIKRV
ncbi:tRNA (adenosine(37)-N6)-threonylcarbamoyltransferase complex dimerization subunit type 1 TsaB [Streptococcus halichoeri]|uniref:tRNA (adenosine(37)-N6)-threonylcarbamoyltransferase complex dimerization subunit type 1 TsaB n=1 Tax=Streptococcus halichoeri TaxID=254785 RepID=UPI001358B246|nr:tRNA (adenosine(37)-N6)-threonylcarbamoyltransferase complex dimerization subunit type 1 TsaB [Streptococcus halichoeri]